MSLRAVIFDYGMVLSLPADPVAHEELVELFGTSDEVFEEQYWAHRDDYDSGAVDGAGYWRKCAIGAGISLTGKQVAALIDADIRMWLNPDPVMVDWALEVKRLGYRTAVVSNIGIELVPPLLGHPFMKSFSSTVWSSRLRVSKPHVAIYHHVLQQLDVEPAEALFIDDRQENIMAARSLGMYGIIYRGPEQLQHSLDELEIGELLPPLPIAALSPVSSGY